jgi:hypothetical protein
VIKAKQIWITDIKQGAVDFQMEQFGVNGILSCANPSDLDIDKRFDLIFVGSLFSHLPNETFALWLHKIYELLTDDGLMIFTVHDKSIKKELFKDKQDILFVAVSEEVNLLSKDGRLPGAQYGVTYVSEQYVKKQIQGLAPGIGKYGRIAKRMWALQDIYIVSKDPNDDFSLIA